MMHSNLHDGWFCGLGGIFHGFHLGGFLPLALLALFFVLLFSLMRGLAKSTNSSCAPAGNLPSPSSILETRYASGEIDREDFLQRKNDLKT